MQRSSFLFAKCSKYSIFNTIPKRIPSSQPITRYFIKRSYAATTTTTTTVNAGPPINAARRVVPLPTKVTEMKLRCKIYTYFTWHSITQLTLVYPSFLGTEFDQNGTVKTTAGEFLKSDFCQHHSLLPRDLRTIDTYSVYQKPTILVRPEAILVNVAHLKALLKSDMVVLFDTYGSTDSYNQSIFIYDLQERLRSQKDGLPFEFRYKNHGYIRYSFANIFIRALEAILISVTSSLQSELDILEGPVNKLLGDLEDLVDIEESMNGDKLRDLLQYSKKLSKFEQDALSIRDALEEVLDNGKTIQIQKKKQPGANPITR
jgi:magnesium transporter